MDALKMKCAQEQGKEQDQEQEQEWPYIPKETLHP